MHDSMLSMLGHQASSAKVLASFQYYRVRHHTLVDAGKAGVACSAGDSGDDEKLQRMACIDTRSLALVDALAKRSRRWHPTHQVTRCKTGGNAMNANCEELLVLGTVSEDTQGSVTSNPSDGGTLFKAQGVTAA